jgi:two-component system, NarL family, nitrate/nitrite response regulator NarL
MRCVIVDDNEAFLEVSRALLERDGVEVVGVARNPTDCLACVRALEPDVLLVDIDLGEESGIELARRLAGEPDVGGARLILMSAHGENEIAEVIEDGVVIGFLTKSALSRQAIETLLAGGRPAVDH